MRRKQIRNRNPDIGESSKVIAFGESNEGGGADDRKKLFDKK